MFVVVLSHTKQAYNTLHSQIYKEFFVFVCLKGKLVSLTAHQYYLHSKFYRIIELLREKSCYSTKVSTL